MILPRMPEETFEKVFLHDRHGDVESCWCEPAGVLQGRQLLRLVNVPFAHAKPTYDDVIAVDHDPEFEGHWAWDRNGVPFSKVSTLIHEDGGRTAAIVDYRMSPGGNFGEIVRWLRTAHDVVAEGCFGPRWRVPGRVYLAVPVALDLDDLLAAMRVQFRAFSFIRVHPPRPKKKATKGRATRAKKAPAKAAKPKTAKKRARRNAAKR